MGAQLGVRLPGPETALRGTIGRRSITVYARPVERGNRRRAGLRPQSRDSNVYLPRADPGECCSPVIRSGVILPTCRAGRSEQIMRSYEVAYGDAAGDRFRAASTGLAQTGNNADGSPLSWCRIGTGCQPREPTGAARAKQNSIRRDVSYPNGWGRGRAGSARLMCSMLPVADGRRILIRRIPYPPYPYQNPYPVQPAQPYSPCRPERSNGKARAREG